MPMLGLNVICFQTKKKNTIYIKLNAERKIRIQINMHYDFITISSTMMH